MHKPGITGFVIGAVILFAASGAFANDSLARVGAGGIEFVKSQISRLRTSLSCISTKLVRKFTNEPPTSAITACPARMAG